MCLDFIKILIYMWKVVVLCENLLCFNEISVFSEMLFCFDLKSHRKKAITRSRLHVICVKI